MKKLHGHTPYRDALGALKGGGESGTLGNHLDSGCCATSTVGRQYHWCPCITIGRQRG
jgi:hypothetical protein